MSVLLKQMIQCTMYMYYYLCYSVLAYSVVYSGACRHANVVLFGSVFVIFYCYIINSTNIISPTSYTHISHTSFIFLSTYPTHTVIISGLCHSWYLSDFRIYSSISYDAIEINQPASFVILIRSLMHFFKFIVSNIKR